MMMLLVSLCLLSVNQRPENLCVLQIAAASKTIIPAVSAMKFPELAVTFPNGKFTKLPITSNSIEVNTQSVAVPKVSLVCLSFRASSQVRTIPYILQWNQGNLSLAFMKISVAVLLVKLSKQELHLHDAVFLSGEA